MNQGSAYVPSEAVLRRLTFVKYLHRLGVEQASAPEPMSSSAILALHDAAELFLQLAAERFNVGEKKSDFMAYFSNIEPALGRSLNQKEAMRRMNSARVAIKHHGTLPSKREVESFCAVATDFFEGNCQDVFGQDYSSISMSAVVRDDIVRACMRTAESCLARSDMNDALESISEAFERLLRAHHMQVGRTSDLDSDARDIDWVIDRNGSRRPAASIVGAIALLRDEVVLLRHGIDTRRLSVFRALTPNAIITMADTVSFHSRPQSTPVTKMQVQFCYDFVLDSALRIEQMTSTAEEVGKDRWVYSAFGRV